MKKIVASVSIFLWFTMCNAQTQEAAAEEFIQNAFYLSEVMLHDVANPPAAARFYAYAMLGAYESVYKTGSDLAPLSSYFHVTPEFQSQKAPDHFLRMFCATYTMLDVGRQILPSGYQLEEKQAKLIERHVKKFKAQSKYIDENKSYAVNIASQIVAYSKKDGYFSLSALPRYMPSNNDGRWYPTPPEYMTAVEPQWKTLRTFFLDSVSQFAPAEPIPFSEDKASKFFLAMSEVYNTSTNLSTEQKSIAAFWDCNPFAVAYSGHAAIGLKKISPGGHWIGITGIACRKAKASFDKTLLAHTVVALALHDAFVSCWTEKYKSDRIRPESAINKYLDKTWRPLLQTPPFPEYTSGHSVVSTVSAEILSHLFGEKFEYTDTSEEYFGLPARSFHSFREAASEAAISRLYGGIHFRDAIEAGQQQGRAIGEYVIQKIKANSIH